MLAGDPGEVTIGVDIGTTAVKAVAVDQAGTVRARARVPHPVNVGEPGTFEHDAFAAWHEGPLRAVAALGRSRAPCTGLGVAACVPSLAALGDDLRPLGPALLYGDRRGGGSQAAMPRSPLDLREGREFLRWLAARWPGARAYWPAQAVGAVALGGDPVIDLFTAMAFFPVFDGVRWDPAELADLGVSERQLPRVVPDLGAAVGTLAVGGPAGNSAAAALTAGGVDVVAEQITVGLTEPGEVLVICGTTLVTWAVVTDDGGDVPGLWRIPHSRPGLCLIGGPSNVGGLFIDWVRRLTGGRPGAVGPAGAGGGGDDPGRVPLWIPYVRGERIPFHDDTLRASLHGLTLGHGPAALRRAACESAGFVIRHQLDMAGCAPTRIVATGGGVRDTSWMQAIADCTGVPVTRSAVPEGGALGMAWLARMAAGLETSADDAHRWFHGKRPVCPDDRWRQACEHRYTQFRALVKIQQRYTRRPREAVIG